MDSASWDRRYAGSELVWTAEPNRFLVAETETLAPGRVVDLACGEGHNAVWLAERGWQAVGVDFSEVGLQKARAPNATGALRLVGEAYPFRPGDRFLLTFDNHNSVNGIREFACVARQHSISLRTGCFCNPGAGEIAFTISRETLLGGEFGDGMTLDDYIPQLGLPLGGAIRASLGLASNYHDVYRFTQFADEFVDLTHVPDDLPPRIAC